MDITKGDQVVFVDEFGDEHKAEIRAVVRDTDQDELVARVEVEPGVIVWAPVSDFEAVEVD